MDVLLSHAVEDFLDAKHLTPKSQTWYTQTLAQFVAWCATQNVYLVDALDTRVLRKYFKHLETVPSKATGQRLATKTIEGHYLAVTGFVRWCVKDYDLPANPAAKLEKPKVEKKVIRIFTEDQISALLDACMVSDWQPVAYRDAAIISVLVDTGIRLAEMCSLTLDNVHLGPSDSYIRVQGKGRKEREVGIGKRTRRALEVYTKFHRAKFSNASVLPYVFVTRVGTQMDEGSVHVLMKRLQERSGITDVRVSAHTFRHTMAAIYLAREGADVYKLSRLLGHERVATTEQYLEAFLSRQARASGSILDEMGKNKK